jgi:hypothetical protein
MPQLSKANLERLHQPWVWQAGLFRLGVEGAEAIFCNSPGIKAPLMLPMAGLKTSDQSRLQAARIKAFTAGDLTRSESERKESRAYSPLSVRGRAV